ncbi:hypothetical protein I552_5411 [Mycobacterium xenopi 3993]|nr:hypothetical protein I552_5411 [Mycobacterium xenopi 3993]
MSCSSTRQLAADALGQNIFAGTTKLVERIRTCGHGHQKRFYGPVTARPLPWVQSRSVATRRTPRVRRAPRTTGAVNA